MNNIKGIKHNLKEDTIIKKRLESIYNSTTKEIEKEIYRIALNSIDEEGNISLQKIKTSKNNSVEIEKILAEIEEIKRDDIEDYITDELNALNLNKRENGIRYLYDFIAFSIIKNMIKEKKTISKHLLASRWSWTAGAWSAVIMMAAVARGLVRGRGLTWRKMLRVVSLGCWSVAVP